MLTSNRALTTGVVSCRAHTKAMPDDAPWADPVVVPDDLRSLQPDVDAYHRELRHASRRRRWRWLTGSRAWQRFAVPVGVALGSLGMAGLVLAVLTLGQPHGAPVPRQQPVAAHPTGAAGEVGGLLPDIAVKTTAGASVALRTLRPALLALVPQPCDCSELLGSLAAQADEVRIPLIVVAPQATDAEVAALYGRAHRGVVRPVFDAAGVLATTYAAHGVTIVGLAPDATVGFVFADVSQEQRLEGALLQLVATGASTSAA